MLQNKKATNELLYVCGCTYKNRYFQINWSMKTLSLYVNFVSINKFNTIYSKWDTKNGIFNEKIILCARFCGVLYAY